MRVCMRVKGSQNCRQEFAQESRVLGVDENLCGGQSDNLGYELCCS
jgi:hypothetical protein